MRIQHLKIAALASVLGWGTANAVEIVSNLTEPYNFGAGLGGVFVEASSFTTDGQSYQLDSVTLDLQVNSPGTVALSLFSDNSGLPGTSLENLGTQSVAVGEHDTVYPASGATLLQPNTRYWLVVEQIGAGSVQWVSTYSTAQSSPGGVTIGNDMYYSNVGQTNWTPQATATDTGQFAVNATAAVGEPYNFIGWYTRDSGAGVLQSFVFKAGATQGCPNYGGPPPTTYVQPCYDPAQTWAAANGVVSAISNAAAPSWNWNGTTLTETGLFWATYFPASNPSNPPLLSFRVENVAITPGTSSKSFSSYQCYDPLMVGICDTASNVFNLWNVIRDDGIYLILATTPSIGTCILYGAGPTPGCPADLTHAGIIYWVLAAPGAPDLDSDGIPDGLDNCSPDDPRFVPPLPTANATQLDADADGYGNLCDGDLNNSGLTSTADYALLRTCLGQPSTASATCARADMNGSGVVTSTDFNLMRGRMNTLPGLSGLHP